MLSVVAEKEADTVYIHADLEGVALLESTLHKIRKQLESDECDHDHLMSESWGSGELSETMLNQEAEDGCLQVHHMKLSGWNQEWRAKHGL